MARSRVVTDAELQARKRTRGGRERLLRAATDLFRENTVAATSLQMLADRLGVSKAAIYHHFKSRDDIVQALLQPVFEDVRKNLATIAALPLGKRPGAAASFYADFLIRHRSVVSAVFFERAALGTHSNKTVDEFIQAVARALCGDVTDEITMTHARMRIYGTAAVVSEDHDCDDQSLHARIAAVLDTTIGSPGA